MQLNPFVLGCILDVYDHFCHEHRAPYLEVKSILTNCSIVPY